MDFMYLSFTYTKMYYIFNKRQFEVQRQHRCYFFSLSIGFVTSFAQRNKLQWYRTLPYATIHYHACFLTAQHVES